MEAGPAADQPSRLRTPPGVGEEGVAHSSPVLARRARKVDRMLIKAGGARRMRAVGDSNGPPLKKAKVNQ